MLLTPERDGLLCLCTGSQELAHDLEGNANEYQSRGCASLCAGGCSFCDLHRGHGRRRQQGKVRPKPNLNT